MIPVRKRSVFAIVGMPYFGRSKPDPAQGQTIAWLGGVEIRRTTTCVGVETRVKGIRRDAREKGLRRLRDYARGKNRSRCKLALSESVVLQEERPGLFRVWASLLDGTGSLPAPVDPKVRLVEIPSETLATEHIARRLTRQVVESAEADLLLCLQGSRWSRDLSECCRLTESARTLPFRPWGDLAIRVREDSVTQATTKHSTS